MTEKQNAGDKNISERKVVHCYIGYEDHLGG